MANKYIIEGRDVQRRRHHIVCRCVCRRCWRVESRQYHHRHSGRVWVAQCWRYRLYPRQDRRQCRHNDHGICQHQYREERAHVSSVPVTWVLDDGTIWSGVTGGVLTFSVTGGIYCDSARIQRVRCHYSGCYRCFSLKFIK